VPVIDPRRDLPTVLGPNIYSDNRKGGNALTASPASATANSERQPAADPLARERRQHDQRAENACPPDPATHAICARAIACPSWPITICGCSAPASRIGHRRPGIDRTARQATCSSHDSIKLGVKSARPRLLVIVQAGE